MRIILFIITFYTITLASCQQPLSVTEQIQKIQNTSSIKQSDYQKIVYKINDILSIKNDKLSDIGEEVKKMFMNQLLDFKYTKNNDTLFIRNDSLLFFLEEIEQNEDGVTLLNNERLLQPYKDYKLVLSVNFSSREVNGHDMEGKPCNFKVLDIEKGCLGILIVNNKNEVHDAIMFNINIRGTYPRNL